MCYNVNIEYYKIVMFSNKKRTTNKLIYYIIYLINVIKEIKGDD